MDPRPKPEGRRYGYVRRDNAPRCEAMTLSTSYELEHQCNYRSDRRGSVTAPELCSKHRRAAARSGITLISGASYRC